MDTRLQEGIIGFLLFVVGKENQTANFICKGGNSLMCKTVVRSAFFFLSFFFFLHGVPAIFIYVKPKNAQSSQRQTKETSVVFFPHAFQSKMKPT